MEILVCIKQVPGTAKVEVDENTGVLKRDGVESKMNPYDLYALETAIRIKEKLGGERNRCYDGITSGKDYYKGSIYDGRR